MFKIRYNGVDEKPETEEHNMISLDYTKDLLNLQDVIVLKVEQKETDLIIHIELTPKSHSCPCCSQADF